MVWLYDGSFDGFLCALHRSYTHQCIPEKLTSDPNDTTLLSDTEEIYTDAKLAKSVSKRMTEHFSKKILERIFHVFLCDDVSRERDLLVYIRMGFKDIRLLENPSHSIVYAIEAYQKRIFKTIHKMHAFVRFEALEDGMLYTKIASPCNVLPLIGTHFVKRFRDEHFIIHDIKRGLIAVWDGNALQIYPILEASTPLRHRDEDKYQKLWKTFFDTVSIESRSNPTVQRQYVPLFYRTLMTEFQDN